MDYEKNKNLLSKTGAIQVRVISLFGGSHSRLLDFTNYLDKKMKTSTWTEINAEANKILKQKYAEAGIEECEIKIPGKCWRNQALSFAHRHKREFYKVCPELLSEMSETVLACTPCHQEIEFSETLTKQVFRNLRPRAITIIRDQEPKTMKKIKPVKAVKQKAKKADWMRPHQCVHCHATLSGLWCNDCDHLSI